MSNRHDSLRDPATIALLDQAAAAGREAHATIHRIADHVEGASVDCSPDNVGPITRAMIRRISQLSGTGQLTLCPHLSFTAPAVVYWLAWAPGRLRCQPCAGTASKQVKGKRENFVCDHCRTYHDPLHSVLVGLPPVVMPTLGISVPAVLVNYGICPDCYAQERPEGVSGRHPLRPQTATRRRGGTVD